MTARPTRFCEITVDSDFTTTALVVVLFIILSLLLTRDIRHILWGVPDQIAIGGTLNLLGAVIALFYCLAFAFRWPNRLVKIGSTLFAAHYILAVALTYLGTSFTPRPTLGFADSILRQISLVCFLVAIADWLRTVTRWVPSSREEREN
jgi:hypothetical protein